MIWKSLLLSAVLAGSALSIGSANAAPVGGAVMAAPAQSWVVPAQYRGGAGRQQDVRPLRDVVEELRSRYGGELISARLEDGGRPVYLIRWRMPDGQVRDFRVDAAR